MVDEAFEALARIHGLGWNTGFWGLSGIASSWIKAYSEGGTNSPAIHRSDIESLPAGSYVQPDLVFPEDAFSPIDFDGLIVVEGRLFDDAQQKFADPAVRAQFDAEVAASEDSMISTSIPDEWRERVDAFERWTTVGFSRFPAMLTSFASAPPVWLIPPHEGNSRSYVEALRRQSARFLERADRHLTKGRLSKIEPVAYETVNKRLFSVAQRFNDDGMMQVLALAIAVYKNGPRPYPLIGTPEWDRDYSHLGLFDIGQILASEAEIYQKTRAGLNQ